MFLFLRKRLAYICACMCCLYIKKSQLGKVEGGIAKFSFRSDGHRMEKPSSMPSYIFDILLRCWRKQPVDRPTFTEIERELLPFYIEFETSHLELVSDRLAAERNEQENDGDDKYNDKPQNQ